MSRDHRPFPPGSRVRARDITSARSAAIAVPDPERLIHLQFRRFAGCPVCHLHLRGFARRHDEITAAGVIEVVVFHTERSLLLPHLDDLPFHLVADPDKRLYREFGVETSPLAVLRPGAWGGVLRGSAAVIRDVARGRRPAPPARVTGGRLGLPADFLIGPDGRIVARYFGTHADDQWSVDRLLDIVAGARDARPRVGGNRGRARFDDAVDGSDVGDVR